jgi:hypothetical protein
MPLTKPNAAQINFDVTNITDPLIRLNSGETGSADKDAGLVVERGDDTNVALIYDESANEFAFINTTETGTTGGDVTIASYATLAVGRLDLDDSATIYLGTSNDFSLYHNGNNSFISDQGTGGIYVLTNDFLIKNAASDETFFRASGDGDVELYYDNSQKLVTTTTGVTVTGTIVATSLTGDVTGDVTGNASGTALTVTQAAQSSITSLGTLTTLTVDNVIINGTTIGHTSDTDLMTLSSGTLDVAGTVDANNITISGGQGSDGQLLTSTGSGVAWEDAAGGGGGTDISGIQNDLATLALYVVTTHDQVAYNLPNTFIDHYEDNSGLDTTSTVMYTEGTHLVTGNPGAGLTNYAADTNTELLLHFDGNNNDEPSASASDSSKNAGTITVTNCTISTSSVDRAPVGGGALYVSSNNSKIVLPGASWMNTEENFTIEFWIRTTGLTDSPIFDFNTQDDHDNEQMCFEMTYAEGGAAEMSFESGGGLEYGGHFKWIFPTAGCNDDDWHHYAVSRDLDEGDDGRWWFYYDGVSQTATGSSDSVTDSVNENPNRDERPMNFFKSISYTSGRLTGSPCRIDEFRFSSSCRYPSGTTFVPNPGPVTTATGNYTSSTETSNATVSNMGIVILYKNDSGTATLDTDLIAEVSADGGTNWTSAPLTAGGTFSTGILIAKSNDITISNTGTTCKYRISFANQSAGSKVTEVHGVSLLY